MLRNNVFIFLILFIFGGLFGCNSQNKDNKELLPSYTDIKSLYLNNESSIKELVDFCKSNPRVKWLGIELTDIDLSTLLSSNLDNASVDRARKILSDLGAVSLMCSRDWSQEGFPLISVTLPLYGAGISVSGVSKGIRFFSSVSRSVDAKVKRGELKSLGENGWYIYLSST